jgi:hypothetical protein
MFGCVLIRRTITATDVTTFGASSQVKPPTALGQAFKASYAARFCGEVDAVFLAFHFEFLPYGWLTLVSTELSMAII